MRRAVTMLVVVVVGAIVVPVAGPMPRDRGALASTRANPAIDDVSARPFVLAWGQLSYAYVDGPNLPVRVTGDLATWERAGDALPDDHLGAWMAPDAGDPVGSPAVAAYPDNPAGERFVLWFTATDAGSGQRCIGAAAGGSPAGPFRADDEPLLCPPGGARDPSPVPAPAGPGGPRQLLFRQDGDAAGLYTQALAPDGRSPAFAAPVPLLLDRDLGPDGGTAERPALVPVGGDRAQLLFTSTTATGLRSIGRATCPLTAPSTTTRPRGAGPAGTSATGTGVGPDEAGPVIVGTSGSPVGAGGTSAAPGTGSIAAGTDGGGGEGGRVIGACELVPGGRQWVVGRGEAEAPGSPQVFGEEGDRWLAYDAYPAGACAAGVCAGEPRMHLDRLCLDDDGHGGEPRTPAPTAGPQPLAREPDCRADQAEGWLTTWAAGFTPVSAQFGPGQAGFAGQTLRQVVHTSVGGGAVRLRLSNTYGDRPLHVGRATVAAATEPAGGRAHVQPLSARPLTFGGAAAVVVPPGGDVLSDAVTLPVPPDHDLAVSLWFPEPTGPPSGHLVALETSYVGAGDLVDDWGPGFAGARPIRSAFYVSAVDVLAEDPAGTVVLLGDSLTDGAGGHDDAEARWPDVVVDRLSGAGPLRLGVANVGIAGNPLLPGRGSTSASALERFDHDVLAHADVSTVVVLLGTNDLVGRGSTGAAIVEGLRQMVARGHAAGLRVIGATIPPLAGPQDPPTPAALELARTQVNRQVLDGGLGFDGVVDMDAALRDPAAPTRVLGRYAWFGGFHPDDEGHRAMGRAVDLALLDPASLPPAAPSPSPPPG